MGIRLRLRLHNCCYECPYNDIQTDSVEICDGYCSYTNTQTEIYCSKENVCKFVEKEINESKEESEQ